MAREGARYDAEPQQQVDEVLQAVVLADSFETKFSPISIEIPRVLDTSLTRAH